MPEQIPQVFSRALAVLALGLAAALASPAQAEDVLTLLDGQMTTGEVATIFRDGSIAGANLPAGLKLENLLHLQRDVPLDPGEFQGAVAYLVADGGAISAANLTLAEDTCSLGGTVGGDLQVKVERLSSLLLKAGPPAEVFRRAQAEPLRLSDILFLNTEEGPRAVEVLIDAITAEEVTIRFEGESRDVSLERVYGIVFADRQREQNDARCRVKFTNGDELAGVILEVSNGSLVLQTQFSQGLELPFSQVAAIEIDSPRHMYLSDVEPLEVEEETILALPSAWRRDLSVGGRPLRLGDRQFSHGFGVHSASRLTFPVERRFETFQAIVGIDAEAEGHGDCEVVILADDTEIFRQRIQGGEPPVVIRLRLEAPRRLTLAVEPGEGYDLADHVSWCDVRLLNLEDD